MKILRHVCLITGLSIQGGLFIAALGQVNPANGDSLHVKKGYMVVLKDTVLRFPADTTILLPGNQPYEVKKDRESRSDTFYGNFEGKSKKNLFLRGIYDATVREQKDTLGLQEKLKVENFHPEYADKIVGSIEVRAVNIIDGNVNDTSVTATRGYAIAMNKMHRDTRDHIILKNLTIHEGDQLGAYTLADNEYHLRSLEYIEDVRIIAVPDSLNPEKVNLVVVVKDIFPVSIGLGIGGLTDYSIGLNSVNIAGSGHQFTNSFRYNSSRDPSFGYVGELLFNNMWGTFINANILYRNDAIKKLSRFTLEREFITPETKYGGGIELYNESSTFTIRISDSVNTEVPYTRNYFDQWIGRSFLLNSISRQSIVLKIRFMTTDYGRRPQVEADTNQQFYNVNLLIGSITLLQKNHYKERMLLGYGLIEDIDFGYAVELTGGYQFGEFIKAPYVALSLKAANKYNVGYLAGGIEYGGHIYQNHIILGLLRVGFTYYSPLFKTNLFHYRFLTRFSYTAGVRRYPYEILNLGKEVRGASNSGIDGDNRLIARFELVTFLRGSLLGFRFSPNVYYDAAFLGSGSGLLHVSNFFSVAGLGVRIRNENLAFRTIIIRLGYYTGNPLKDAHMGVGFTTSVPDVIREYDIVKPDLLRY
jgi:hypothetical protein